MFLLHFQVFPFLANFLYLSPSLSLLLVMYKGHAVWHSHYWNWTS